MKQRLNNVSKGEKKRINIEECNLAISSNEDSAETTWSSTPIKGERSESVITEDPKNGVFEETFVSLRHWVRTGETSGGSV